MTCRNVAQLRDRHLDGELSPSLSAEVHAHLLQCPACQRQMEMFRAAGEVIRRDRSEPRLAPAFASRVVAAMNQRPRRSNGSIRLQTRRALRERFWRLTFSVSLPAAAAMLFLGVLIWPVGEPRSPQGIVLGVRVRATDASGVHSVAAPAVSAVHETVRAASSLSQIQRILTEPGNPDGIPQGPATVAPTPEITLLNALLFPFNESLEPVASDDSSDAAKSDVVRF